MNFAHLKTELHVEIIPQHIVDEAKEHYRAAREAAHQKVDEAFDQKIALRAYTEAMSRELMARDVIDRFTAPAKKRPGKQKARRGSPCQVPPAARAFRE